MSKIKPSEFPDIVIRPSGVWNSRAPLHDFINQHIEENRAYYVGILTIEKLRYEIRNSPMDSPARSFFGARNASPLSGRAWHSYKRTFTKNSDKQPVHPNLRQVLQDLNLAYQAYNEHAIVSYSSLFELFVQCWALNYLLCKLETNQSWNQAERHLAMDFCPVVNGGHIPTVLNIGKAIPLLIEELSNRPHIHLDPKTNTPIDSPITPNLNAWKMVLFWRDWRNLIIHRSGLISNQFFDKHNEFYNEYIESMSYSPETKTRTPSLKVGDKLTLNDATFKGVVTVHYRASTWINQHLEKMSLEKRGHPFAPNKKPQENDSQEFPFRSPQMFLEGDNELSRKWLNDEIYRGELITKMIGANDTKGV